MSGSISIWPQIPGFSRAAAAPEPAPAPAPQVPTLASGMRSRMADALYDNVYAKSLSREDFDKRTAGLSDTQIADGVYKSFYDGKIDRAEFNAKVGLQSVGSGADAIMRGGMIGFADEAAAGVMTGARTLGTLASGRLPTFESIGNAYNQELQGERDKRAVFNQNNPYLGTGLEIAGGLLTAGAGAGTTAVAAPTRMQTVREAARLGAVTGFGEGEGGLESRLVNAGVGAGIGAGIGAAAPYAVQGIGMALGRAGRVLGLGNSDEVASQMLLKAFQDDGIPANQIATRLAEWQAAGSKPAALFDLGGENVRRLARTAAGRTGPGTERAVTFLEGRQADQMGRVLGDVEANLGQSADDFHTRLAALRTKRSTEAAPKYESAFSRITPTADEAATVARFVNDPIGQNALNEGMRVVQLEHLARNQPFKPEMYGVVRGENGRWMLEPDKVPNLRLYDAVKRGFDEIVEGFRDSTTGRLQLNQYGRAVNDVRAAYTGQLRDMYQRYGAALDAWAGPSQLMDAANRGRNVFNLKDAEAVQAATAVRNNPTEAEAFRLGVAQAIRDKMANAQDGADAVKRMFGSPTKRALLRAAFPDERSFLAFESAMKRETSMFENAQFVSPRTGSQTQLRESDAEGAGNFAADMAGALVTGGILPGRTVGTSMAQALMNASARSKGINSATAEALARQLFTADASAIGQTATGLSQREIQNALAKIEARRLAGALLPGLSAGVNVAR